MYGVGGARTSIRRLLWHPITTLPPHLRVIASIAVVHKYDVHFSPQRSQLKLASSAVLFIGERGTTKVARAPL
jgi:hypothetical protein